MAQDNSPPLQHHVPRAIPLLKSCESCRQRKIKCSGDKPICANCARRNQPCIYRRSARYKRRLNGAPGGSTDSNISTLKEQKPNLAAAQNGNTAIPTAPGKGLVAGNSSANGILSAASKDTAYTASMLASAQQANNGSEELAADDSMPLAALFGTAPMDESDVLPPSILQNMNFWMNDSLLTAAVAAAGIHSYDNPQPQSGMSGAEFLQLQPTSTADTQQSQTQTQISLPSQSISSGFGFSNNNGTNNFIPMELALGLPALTDQFSSVSNGTFSNPSVTFEEYNSLTGFDALSTGGLTGSFGMDSNFLLSLNHPFNQLQPPSAASTSRSSTIIQSPPLNASPNPLLGPADVGTFAPFPTSAFASLNLANTFDNQGVLQNTTSALQAAGISKLFSAAAVTPTSYDANNVSAYGDIRPVPSAQPFRSPPVGDSKPGSLPRHNTIPLSRGHQAMLALGSDSGATHPANSGETRNNTNLQAQGNNLVTSNASQSIASATTLGNTSAKQPPRMPTLNMGTLSEAMLKKSSIPAPSSTQSTGLSADFLANSNAPQRDSPYVPKLSSRISTPVSPCSSGASIVQMNNDVIPQILKDAVIEHPELGSAELIYNLLITHVVHDCSRIGIYNAHLYWMRVRQYKLPKFYLFSSIADASRSWTLSDELRMALPPNLDETCYALAIKYAPTDVSNPNVLAAIGLLVLSSYEFKSARFAQMVEHSCLAYKVIIHIKFRGAPFPWRRAKKRTDSTEVDWNYQLLIRAYWRISSSLYYSTEIFRLDAPDDREFLPEMPESDDYFIRHVFVPDESEEFGFRAVVAPYEICDSGRGDLTNIVCELVVRQYKIANRFNRVLRGEKAKMWYINYMLEWDRQMLEWRDNLPSYLDCDLEALARTTQPLGARSRRINLWGLSEDEMWQKRHQWNRDVGRTMEVLNVHMMFEMTRLKAHRIGLMMLLHEDLDMVRNFQYSKAFTVQDLPRLAHKAPLNDTYDEDRELFHNLAEAANEAASHVYDMLKFNYQFGFDLHAYNTIIISTLLQVSLVYVGQVQSSDTRLAWHAMLRLARILGMIRSLDRWGPALYIFTNILKALGRPELILRVPSPETRAQLSADTCRPAVPGERAMSIDSAVTGEASACMDFCCQSSISAPVDSNDGTLTSSQLSSSKGKRKNVGDDAHGDEKRYEFSDHHHGDPHSVSSLTGSPVSDEEDMTNPFPPDHVISHIMREQKVSTATFFSPTLPVLAASLLRTNST
ncbi:hypothetical protein COEREDRAFT_79078 [Coemansia reversa NRRL 1564]|uniref:Zn(2)-C6 fungal-type domain-containing protein n=1 Tax=Coemansia reversa (strain ATCC 12441 / NRRL 1564) TaxID=763665 RepID=A0A2G5BK29_COERN|nr:hypothetical protein COEREDRAFT_79078 [Coemansia reversa NRRL 1564]|eukprot:PIA19097.1 hypothetical protein COEREDRAFT_79078 [Coemansia reversa NRRL 1564]